MIVDCHTHIWANLDQLGQDGREFLRRQAGRDDLRASANEHAAAAACADRCLVLGLRSRALGACVPNEFIAGHVAAHRDKMIGIAAVDPLEGGAAGEAEALLDRPEFGGLALSPAWQCFHPSDSRAMGLYELAERRRAPVFFTHAVCFPAQGVMEYARPALLDEVAREFPDLVMVISSLGHPWVEEGLALMGKHPRVYGDIAGLVHRPWEAYNALVQAHHNNVMDKVLFASGFPLSTPAAAIEAVYRLHEVAQGTNLPTVPREVLRGMVERDALAALGIARAGRPAAGMAGRGDEP